ncbi:MAG: VTT domain-containing protein [Gammaproteobacteria bacterium]
MKIRCAIFLGCVAFANSALANSLPVELTGSVLVIALISLAFSTFISEDATCIGAGLLVASGQLPFWPAAIACLIGIFVGDALLFLLGRVLGTQAIERAPLKWVISNTGIETAKAWFARRGAIAIVTSRFVPGTRLPTYVAAGALGASFARFSGWFLLAAVIWTPSLVALSAAAGNAIWTKFDLFASYALPALITTALVLVLLLRVVLPLTNHRGRRILLGRWRRLTRYEFWPRWVFYPPVVCYILWLGLRYRCLTLFTAVNPAIPDGGFIGESKDDILTALWHSDPRHVPLHKLLPDARSSDERAAVVLDFMTSNELTFPIVLKPNEGDRGTDVTICHSQADVDLYLEEHESDTLVQEHSPGQEFGVFYVRHPNEKHGYVFSITEKRLPMVTGDGESTLEQLILNDDRAVCKAPAFLDVNAHALFDVPAKGEKITLMDIGSHSRGCAFLEGGWVHTQELADAIDHISTGYEGFFFGRYDIRTPDVDAFQRGEQFKIVELNGVTAEASNIYDPSNTLFYAYRTLAHQWRLAFEIGAANRANGAQVTPVWTLLKRSFQA